ncbi:MAG: hypothetical protein PHV04_10145 [Clostridia bacterium]|nr:hypothetical protein [Clostridia bacterium]MDD3094472.1 hypothetical protein [Clostridia bacterium]MDD4034005.1 hypothetical protein [Candidatus Cloacimonadota bacterium]
MKSIVVVTTKELKNHGRVLCHLLSKKDSLKAGLWDLKDYTGNEKTAAGNNYFVFIGDNEVTKPLTPMVENWIEDQGVKVGYDYRKAFIQQFGKPTDMELLNKALKDYWKEIIASFFGPWIITLIAMPGPVNPFPIALALKYIKLSKDRKNTTMNQYTYGIKRFMEASLEGFLNN